MKLQRVFRRTPEDHWIPLSDLMTGLMMLFLLVAIIFMLQLKAKEKEVKDIGKNYTDLRSELCSDLQTSFKDNNNDWKVDPSCNLSIRFLNPDNQFDVGKSEVKSLFRTSLNIFFPKYIEILNSEKYRDVVEEIRIEGHTSRLWGNPPIASELAYYKNMALSQERSRVVLEYVLSIPTARLPENWNWLVQRLTANGLSGINPVKNPDKSDNDALSQRVEFRIRTKTEARLNEILKALAK